MQARAYTDPAIFALEMKRIFDKAWFFVGHDSQIPKPGCFRRTRIGQHEVILVRQRSGEPKVFFNACTHRGTRLCVQNQGATQLFVCPYHSWTFGLDGELRALPNEESYAQDIRPGAQEYALKVVPRVATYNGFIFASLAQTGSELREFLGPMTEAIDNLVARAPGGSIAIEGGSFKVRYRGNWKLHHENANDTVHPGFVHNSSVQTAKRAPDDAHRFDDGQTLNMMAANGFGEKEWQSVELHGFAQGHSFMGGFYKSGILGQRAEDDVTKRYRIALEAAHGEEKAEQILRMDRFNNLIWPTLSVNAQFHQIRVVQPISVNETLIEGYCFRLANAPEEVFHRAVRFLSTLVSPASMIFADDIEIFERVQRGLEEGDIDRVDAGRGADSDVPYGAHGAWRSVEASELPMRVQARAWREWMTRSGDT